jgi:uncharacterized alpha-E superfamily protein
MLAELADAEVEDIIREGLHEFLTRFINQNAALGQDLADGFLFGVR